MADQPKGGTILQDKTGNFYFLRDELLEGYKVTDPDDIAACAELLGSDTVGFAAPTQAVGESQLSEPNSLQLAPIGLGFMAMRVQGLGFRTAC